MYTLNLRLSNIEKEFKADSVEDVLDLMAKGLDVTQIKTRAWIKISDGKNSAERHYFIPQMRRLINNPITRKITAKVFNGGLK